MRLTELTEGYPHASKFCDLRNINLTTLKGVDFSKYDSFASILLDGNYLTDLEGSPTEAGSEFSADNNELTSLRGAPKIVRGSFSVIDNPTLSTLEGGPEEVGTYYYAMFARDLKSLEGIARKIGGGINFGKCGLTTMRGLSAKWLDTVSVQSNKLTDLMYSPRDVGEFDASSNKLLSLKGAPAEIDQRLWLDNNNSLTNLKGIGREFILRCPSISMLNCPIKSHALGLCLVKKLEELEGDFPGIEILRKYMSQGHDALIDCQHELIEAGLEELAQL